MYLLRGNHECRSLTEHFTFRQEILDKYDIEIYDMFMESFDMMPLAAVVNNQYVCMHGGISPELTHLSVINKL